MSKCFASVSGGLRIAAGLLIFSAFSGTAFAVRISEAPEVDPSTMAGAVALLSAGGMFMADRLLRKTRAKA